MYNLAEDNEELIERINSILEEDELLNEFRKFDTEKASTDIKYKYNLFGHDVNVTDNGDKTVTLTIDGEQETGPKIRFNNFSNVNTTDRRFGKFKFNISKDGVSRRNEEIGTTLRIGRDKDKIIQKLRDKFGIGDDTRVDYEIKNDGEIELTIGNKKTTGVKHDFQMFYSTSRGNLKRFGDFDFSIPIKPKQIGDFIIVGGKIQYENEIKKLSSGEYSRINGTIDSDSDKSKKRLEKAGKSKSIEEFLSYFPDRETKRKEREEERREKLIKRLKKNEKYFKGKLKDVENMELSMLEDLSQELKENPEYRKEVEKEWREREKGIVNGINYMVQKGLIVDDKNKEVTEKQLYAESKGGPSQSDIKVHLIDKDGNDKFFFVESKLTYDTAEYFKFNVTVDGNKIKYDHKFHRSHVDKTKSKEEQKKELKKIDDIFKKIDLGGIITEVIAGTSDNELTQEWKTFIDNWNEMIRFIQKMFEKDSSFEGYKFESPNNKFPEQFMLVGKYYQHYFEFYADVYDKIIDKIFERYIKKDVLKDGEETFTRDDFKLQRSETNKDRVLQSASRLRTFIPKNKIEETNPLFDEIIKIEGKFLALTKRLSKKINDFRDLSLDTKSKNDAKIVSKYSGKISSKDSLKYFYQMFISTTGRKTKNSETFKEVGNESLGVMQLTPIVEFQTKKINQAITIYYLNKDNVAYLQVLRDIFMLRKDFDPLGLVAAIGKDYKINLLNEVDNKFTCSLVVSDDLSEISLHVRMNELEGENRKEISFDIRDKGQGFIGTDFQGVKKNKLHIKEKDFSRKLSTKNISDKKQMSEDQQELEEEVNKVLNESDDVNEENEIEEGLETSKTEANKYELRVTDSLQEFLKSQKSPYNTLEVEHYEEPDMKYWSDIKVTNPKNNRRFWVEAKEDKYACLGSGSFKYTDGEWTCTTIEDNDPLLEEILGGLRSNGGTFLDFCKKHLGKEDISLPRDITDDLVSAWQKSGNIEDTDNDVLFITSKIPMDDFGAKIASFYKRSKNESAYYIHVGDDLYLIDETTNILGLRTRDGKPLKTLAEAYRIGRIQFRLKRYNRPQKVYYSIYLDVKILADKENLDENYSCSFLDREKWPVIDNGNTVVTTDKTEEMQVGTEVDEELKTEIENVMNEDSVDDIISDMKNVKSTNSDNPDTKIIKNINGSKTLTLMVALDGRLTLTNVEGETLRRDDGGQMYFDDESDAVKWAEERGYEVDDSIEREGLTENIENVKLLTNVPEDTIKNILDTQKIENPRFEKMQFEKYLGIPETTWTTLMDKEGCLAIAAVKEDQPFNGYCYIEEIQSLKKGHGQHLLKELFKKYRKVWLMSNTAAGETLTDYYRKLGLEEIVIGDSVYGCPAHFFCTKECDYDKMENYLIAFYSNEEDEEQLNENGNSDIKLGLIIKNTKNHFLDNILSGKKTIETRYEVPMKRILNKIGGLKNLIGSKIAIIDDKQQIVGTAIVSNLIKYETREEFENDIEKHMVDANDIDYGWKDGKIKYGIELSDVITDGFPKKITYNDRYQNQNDRLNGFLSNVELLNVNEAEKDIGGEKSDLANTIQGDKIWIDDIREAPQGFKWFKTVREFIKYIDEHGTEGIELIDTNHDAGDYQKFGGDYIRCFDYLDFLGAKDITIHIHSANPVGANNIRRIISKNKEDNNWKEVRNTNDGTTEETSGPATEEPND